MDGVLLFEDLRRDQIVFYLPLSPLAKKTKQKQTKTKNKQKIKYPSKRLQF